MFLGFTLVLGVNRSDADCEPLFLFTAEVNDSMLSMVNGQIMPYMKKLSGERRMTLIFDRAGHQTSVMTTRQNLSVEQIAARMFSRWSQENFFRYMRHEYSLDHLITYDVEAADSDRLVPCPRYKEKSKEISKMKSEKDRSCFSFRSRRTLVYK